MERKKSVFKRQTKYCGRDDVAMQQRKSKKKKIKTTNSFIILGHSNCIRGKSCQEKD